MLAADVDEARALVAGKTVALVGNSTDLTRGEWGAEIDAHDVVIRMNAGAPGLDQTNALGTRTTVQTLGTLSNYRDCRREWRTTKLEQPGHLWWMKNTTWGDRQFARLDPQPGHVVWRFPSEWQSECVETFVPAPVSSGTVLLWAMVTHGFDPAKLDVYGMTFFGASGASDSWWHKTRTPPSKRCPHDGRAEMRAIRLLGFQRRSKEWPDQGNWTWTP